MRIVQIIDSLEVGGAERMAVNYANALSERITFSGLVATRKEGQLKSQLNDNVDYFFLNRRGAIGISAIFRLKSWCKKHQVDYVHAHSSSFFTASLLKLIHPKIKVIWHDHYGMSEFLASRPSFVLRAASLLFSGIISVNALLKDWATTVLHFKNTIYLTNFSMASYKGSENTLLKGIKGKQIICLANLRPQKNHFLLLKVAEKLKRSHPEWTFHLVGKDFNDDYSNEIHRAVASSLNDTVYIYGAKNDTGNIISQAAIAILTSDSEGLPVALLEYGQYAKPVVVTNVGEIPTIINGKNGLIVSPREPQLFYEALVLLIENPEIRSSMGAAFSQTIVENHSQNAVMDKYLNWITTN